MTDLAEFLLARIAEDEANWRAVLDREREGTPATLVHGEHWATRVLAECSAKRKIVERHKPVRSWSGGALQCEHCADLCHSRSGLGCEDPDAPYPCPDIRDLASVYADHPDYREEWRP